MHPRLDILLGCVIPAGNIQAVYTAAILFSWVCNHLDTSFRLLQYGCNSMHREAMYEVALLHIREGSERSVLQGRQILMDMMIHHQSALAELCLLPPEYPWPQELRGLGSEADWQHFQYVQDLTARAQAEQFGHSWVRLLTLSKRGRGGEHWTS